MKNAMSLKARIRNLSKIKKIPAQVILQNYMFERFLFRLSMSEYKEKFVIKGGILVSAIIGLDQRATMDLDTTLKNLPLTPEDVEKAIRNICEIKPENDEVEFIFSRLSSIRKDDVYGGYRVYLTGKYDTLIVPLTIDVTTGDIITPNPILYSFQEMFEDNNSFELWAYNLETVLAEKAESILNRGIDNTRPRDYYDAYILSTTQSYNKNLFLQALSATAVHRGSEKQIQNPEAILDSLTHSKRIQDMWSNYRASFPYAENIEFDQLMEALKKLMDPYTD